MSKKEQFEHALGFALLRATDTRARHEENNVAVDIIEVIEVQKGIVWLVLGARPDYLDYTCFDCGWELIDEAAEKLVTAAMAVREDKDARAQLVRDFCKKYVWSAE